MSPSHYFLAFDLSFNFYTFSSLFTKVKMKIQWNKVKVKMFTFFSFKGTGIKSGIFGSIGTTILLLLTNIMLYQYTIHNNYKNYTTYIINTVKTTVYPAVALCESRDFFILLRSWRSCIHYARHSSNLENWFIRNNMSINELAGRILQNGNFVVYDLIMCVLLYL